MTSCEIIGSCALYLGDAREILTDIRADAHACVLDPPYHLASIVKRFGTKGAAPAKSNGATGVYKRQSEGFLGESWDAGSVSFDPETWAIIGRALRPGAHLASFAARENYHRLACAIEAAGFDIRDMFIWMYATGKPNSHNVGRMIGSKEEPNQDWKDWGTDIKGAHEPICLARKKMAEDTVAANVLAHGTSAFNIEACRTDGGRWPATVLHDGSVEVYAGLPVGGRDMLAVLPCMKPSKAERDFGLPPPEDPKGKANKHPTVKPVSLMQWLCRLLTPPAGVVLDPFMGSGTTGMACVYEGFRFVGIEKDQRYFDVACRRIEAAVREFDDTVMGAVQREALAQ